MIVVLQLISALLMVYILLLALRILLSWFQGSVRGRPWELLRRITDPYLSLFTPLRFLRRGAFDLSPLAAVLVLVVLLDLVNALLFYGRITLGLALASLLGALWSGVSFLLLLLLILALVKVLGGLFRRLGSWAFLQAADMLVQPVVGLVERVLPIIRRLSELQSLAVTIVFLFLVRFLGGMLASSLVRFFHNLPV